MMAIAPFKSSDDGRRVRVQTSAQSHLAESTPIQGTDASPLRAVLCGTYRRDVPGLCEAYEQLRTKYEVLSPISLDFVNPSDPFVRLPHEVAEDASTIEQRHLDRLSEADFVWLHCPEGYLGLSATFELGHAKALGIPIFASHPPAEEVYRPWITIVSSPSELLIEQALVSPGNGLRTLQGYYERTAARRGWSAESPKDTMLLMTEEMGELARAVRKSGGLARDQDWEGQDVAEELADVQLYLVHLANALNIDIAKAVTDKEFVNARRAAGRTSAA